MRPELHRMIEPDYWVYGLSEQDFQYTLAVAGHLEDAQLANYRREESGMRQQRPEVADDVLDDVAYYNFVDRQYLWHFCLWRLQAILEGLIVHVFLDELAPPNLVGIKAKLGAMRKAGYTVEDAVHDELLQWARLRNSLSHAPPEQYRPGALEKADIAEYQSVLSQLCKQWREEFDNVHARRNASELPNQEPASQSATAVRRDCACVPNGPELVRMTDTEVQDAVKSAIGELKSEIPALDLRSVHERSTAHCLAVHLEPHFKTWNVDCEYDRDGQLRKTLLGIAQCNPRKAKDQILPDIIIHRRSGRGRDHNLLVIELKKHAAEDACDKKKLERLTDPAGQYQYQLGLYINIDGGRFACTWYKDGQRDNEHLP